MIINLLLMMYLKKLNSELINENRNDFANIGNDQIELYDEITAKNKFFERNKNESIISFLIFLS